MAVDETLLEAAWSRGACTLRFYQWLRPTLSLGYFQSAEAIEDRWRRTALVRRASGGGAIMHDAELTYSLVVPPDMSLSRRPSDLYRAVHLGVVACLSAYGIEAYLNDTADDMPAADLPFLCFARRSEGDVLVSGHKVCGSAQRRRRGAVLQHGSILLRTSPEARGIPGLDEITGVEIDASEFADAMTRELAVRLGLSLEKRRISAHETDRAGSIVSQVYGCKAWLQRR